MHPVEAVAPGIGTRYADLDPVKTYVRTQLRRRGCSWQVRVVDATSAVVDVRLPRRLQRHQRNLDLAAGRTTGLADGRLLHR